jgi:hypothetical protein
MKIENSTMPTSRSFRTVLGLSTLCAAVLVPSGASALDGTGTLRINPANGWLAFEVISEGDNPDGDGFDHAMPGTFDGAGAYMLDADTLRIMINHETSDASVSEVDIDLVGLQAAITNVMDSGSVDGVTFVDSARQAYGRWSDDAGQSWTDTTDTSNTDFSRFCSSQHYEPDTFGTNLGFVDHLYITGEEVSSGRLFVIDSANRDLYQLSGVTGSAPGGLGGMPFDAWENAALIDTGETDHVAILLSPDGGSTEMQLYIGEKGKDATGASATDFLARNGLAYGSYYYLASALPSTPGAVTGSFETDSTGALAAAKMEDVDTSPSAPTKVVLGNQIFGTYVLDFSLSFNGGFDAAGSSFTIDQIAGPGTGTGDLDSADNLDWTDTTTLNGADYPDGLVFVNEDNGSGQIWMLLPDGSASALVGSTTVSSESTGIFDLSQWVGYEPGSIMVTNNQGSSSMTVLINPDATVLGGDGDGDGDGDGESGDADGDGSGTGDGGTDGEGMADGETSGCNCTQGPSEGGGVGWLAALGLLGMNRRRRVHDRRGQQPQPRGPGRRNGGS